MPLVLFWKNTQLIVSFIFQFFGYCAMIGYGVDAFLKFKSVRAGEIAQGSRTVHVQQQQQTVSTLTA